MASKESRNGGDPTEGGTSAGVPSKKAKKESYEKQLEDVNKELSSKSSNSTKKGASKKPKMKPEQEMTLLEQKCVLLLKLKRHKDVVDDGYSIIGRMGPNVTIYKCIIIALVRLGKSEDDIIELLEAWKKATPKCPHMLETKRKFDGYLAALRSGVKYSDIFNSVEDALGLNAEAILNKQFMESADETRWRYRAPPPRHTAFSLCPRASSGDSCIYGEECLFAHSQDELREWKLRVDGDKKDNNALDDAVDSCNRSTKKRPIPNIYRSLLIPPLCIHYLLDLGKKIKEAADVKDILTDELQGVKLKIGTPLHYKKRIDGNKIQCLWSFMVGSKSPMGTVSVLHDANRECFRISSGMYYNKKKESLSLIELHPNNKVQTRLQVLNTFIQPSLFLRFNYGWPEMCYYKVDVTFESRDPFVEPGLYRQSIVFDFKKDPKLVKHICVEILPQVESTENDLSESMEVNLTKSVWNAAVTPPTAPTSSEGVSQQAEIKANNLLSQGREGKVHSFISNNYDFPLLDQFRLVEINEQSSRRVDSKVSNVVDSDSGVVIKLPGVCMSGSFEFEASSEGNLFMNDIPLTKDNYCSWMRDFVDVELGAREKMLNKFKTNVDMKLFATYLPGPDWLYKYSSEGVLYGRLEMMSDISCDTKVGKLITEHCKAVLLSVSPDSHTTFRKPTCRYFCRITDKLKSAIMVAIGRTAANELMLLSDSTRQLQIQFVLDPLCIDRMKSSIELLSKHRMGLLFPDFENSKLPFLKVMDSFAHVNEEELMLNSRQLSVYNLLTGRKALIDGDVFTPPILLTGPVCTGKTHLIAHCLRALLRSYVVGAQPHRILVCTQSDLAADVYITEYLHRWLIDDELSVQRAKPLRIYGTNRFVDTVSGAIKHYCLFNNDGTTFRYPTKEEVLSHKVIIVTLSTCFELMRLNLEDDTFSHIIIDEAAQCLEVECIQPITLAGKNTKILIAGDVMQTHLGMFTTSRGVPPISLLERLRNMYPFRHPFAVNLVENYTNHEVIVKFISEVFYHDQLRPASNQPCHPKMYPLSFHHVHRSRELQADNGGGYYNMEEIRCVVDFTEELTRSWPDTWGSPDDKDSIVVVTPYVNHIMGLRVQLQLKGLQSVGVDMVSNILGRRFRVVIISTVRTFKHHDDCSPINSVGGTINGAFFSDRRLISNALCCAKSLVIVFGDAISLCTEGSCRDIWRKYITECRANKSFSGLSPDLHTYEDTAGTNFGSLSVRESKPTNSLQGGLQVNETLDNNLETRTLSHPKNYERIPEPKHELSSLFNIPRSPEPMENSTSWNIQSLGKHEAPKSDLFSAFSSQPETLYVNNPRTELIPKEKTDTFPGRNGSSLNTPFLNLDKSAFAPVEGYRSPFDMPSVTQNATDFDFKDFKTSRSIASMPVAVEPDYLIAKPSKAPEPSYPPPSTSPQLLFGQSLLISSPGPSNDIQKPFSFGNVHSPSQKFFSPILRSPPGFASMSTEHKLGTLFPTENTASQPMSQFKGTGFLPKYTHKRNTYELPPRMLRNLQLTNHRSPVPRKPSPKPAPPEMNFFEELGLDSQLTNETSRSTSSTSSDNSFIETDDAESVVEEGFVSPTSQSDWIEVKNSRRGKNAVSVKKGKSREKNMSLSDESTEASTEMSVDDKVELITQMGFTKTQAIKALQACEKDLQSAVDWLISKPVSNKSSP